MLKPLFKFEEGLLRVERWLLVGCVLLMLALAGYTVFYRNVLISIQNHLATSGPPIAEQVEPVDDDLGDDPGDEPGEADDDGFGGGFGGGFGDEEPEQADEDDEDDADDGFGGGFGGGFGQDEEAEEEEAPEEPSDEDDGFGGGFGGGFGDGDDAAPSASDQTVDDQPSADQPAADAAEVSDMEPVGGPPPKGSFAADVIETIDAVKFHWLDVLLRQLVIICGFLGAMLATRQRSHITVDAVGKLLKGRTEHVVHTITSLVAAVVCVFLAMSGWDLVSIGREFPRQLIPWLKDWHFQLAFPVGWGLLAFHFVMRTVESAALAHENPTSDQISPDDDSKASILDAQAHEEAL